LGSVSPLVKGMGFRVGTKVTLPTLRGWGGGVTLLVTVNRPDLGSNYIHDPNLDIAV
jgi:hypothetical protein